MSDFTHMEPTLTSGTAKIIEQGALASFMLLVIIVLVLAVRALYNRNLSMGDMLMKALMDNTASNYVLADKIENSNKLMSEQIERMRNAK